MYTMEFYKRKHDKIKEVKDIRQLREAGIISNTLQQLLEAYPDKEWNFEMLSYNPNVSMKNIADHPNKNWDFRILSHHSNITVKDVAKHPNLPWLWDHLTTSQFITLQDILDHSDLPSESLDSNSARICLPWEYDCVCANPNIEFEDIAKHPKLSWNAGCLMFRDNIKLQYILDHPEIDWDWEELSQTLDVKIEEVIAHPEIEWDWRSLTLNENITLKDIIDHPEWPWQKDVLSAKMNIPIEEVIAHPEILWNWACLSVNPAYNFFDKLFSVNLPSESTDSREANSARVGVPWNWDACGRGLYIFTKQDLVKWLNAHPHIKSMEDLIEAGTSKEWKPPGSSYSVMEQLIMHIRPDLKFSDVKDHPDFPWNFAALSENYFELNEHMIKHQMKKYKSRLNNELFMNHLQVWRNHFDFKPEGDGAIQTIKDWNNKIEKRVNKINSMNN